MTPNQISKLITSLQYRKKMSQTIDDLESKVIAFIMVKDCQNKPLIIGNWRIFFDGEELSISEAPRRNVNQLSLFERRSCT